MDGKKLFEKYYARLAREGMLKALFSGLAIGFITAFLVAFGLWFTDIKVLWIAIGVLVLVTAGTTPVFYFKRFRPDAKAIARRLDRLGLEERLITMTELDGDDSYIATLQREDAKVKLNSVDKKQLKLKIPVRIIVAVCVGFVLGVGMMTVVTLSDLGIIGKDLIDIFKPTEEEKWIAVSYMVDGEGEIEGEEEQMVLYGQDAEAVTAVAADGWEFIGWDIDASEDPRRQDKAVIAELSITAIFAELEEGEQGDESEGDGPLDAPGSEGQGPGSGQSGQPSDTGGGRYEEKNQIIDGTKYYRDYWEEYFEKALQDIQENGDKYSDEEKAIILAYYEAIK